MPRLPVVIFRNRRLSVCRTRDSWTETEPARILEGQGMPMRTTRTMQACAVFYATPTTTAVERIFSIAGFVVSSRRTSLSDEMFEFLLFNHLNSDLRTFRAIVD